MFERMKQEKRNLYTEPLNSLLIDLLKTNKNIQVFPIFKHMFVTKKKKKKIDKLLHP